jgi:hypothetical protein
MLNFQVAQIYKDPSVGNPVSVTVVKVEILKVRGADCKISIQDVSKRVVHNYIMPFLQLILWDVNVANKVFLEANDVLTWSVFLLLNILIAHSFFCFFHSSYFLFLFSSFSVAISLLPTSWMFPLISYFSIHCSSVYCSPLSIHPLLRFIFSHFCLLLLLLLTRIREMRSAYEI